MMMMVNSRLYLSFSPKAQIKVNGPELPSLEKGLNRNSVISGKEMLS